MSEEMTNSRNGILNLPELYGLLNGLEECNVGQTISRLKTVMDLLRNNPVLCVHFCKLGGVQRVVNYLCSDHKSITEIAFFILVNCADNDNGTRIELTKEKVFVILSKYLQDLECFSYKLAPYIMYLLTSIINGSGIGQTLVRESKCQYHMVVVFHRLLQLITRVTLREEQVQTWTSLCLAMKSCISNPQNIENQHQLGLILPKALVFIESCFALDKCNNGFEGSVECLLQLLTQIMSNNESNQLNFSIYHGMPIIVRAIDLMENSKDSSPGNENVLEKLIHLLDASVCDNAANCNLAVDMGAMPILIKVLHKLNNKHKIAAMVTLAHLIGMTAQSREEFAKYNGVGAVALAMIDADDFPEVRKAANCLLQSSTQNISINIKYTGDHDAQPSRSQLHNFNGLDGVPKTPRQIVMHTSNLKGNLQHSSHHNNLVRLLNSSKMNEQMLLSNPSCETHNNQLSNNAGYIPSRNSSTENHMCQQPSDAPADNGRMLHNLKRSELSMNRAKDDGAFIKPQPPKHSKCNQNTTHTYRSASVSKTSYMEHPSPTVKHVQTAKSQGQQYYKKSGNNSVRSNLCNCKQRFGSGSHSVVASISTPRQSHEPLEHKPYSSSCKMSTPRKSSSSTKVRLCNNPTVCQSVANLQSEFNEDYTSVRQIDHWLTQQNMSREADQRQRTNSARRSQDSYYRDMHFRNKTDDFTESCSSHRVQYDISGMQASTPQCMLRDLEMQSESEENTPYTDEEIKNLANGVFTYGMNFKAILAAYKFHSSRSSADLLLKWKSD